MLSYGRIIDGSQVKIPEEIIKKLSPLKMPDLCKPLFIIYPNYAVLIAQGKCPCCDNFIIPETFIEDINKREYSISGMCIICQDECFEKY
jgi:hypothetical protein